MEILETNIIDGKVYITNVETIKEIYEIPSETEDGKLIYGIDSFAFINQPIKELVFPKELKEIRKGAIIDCENLETVYINGPLKDWINLDECFYKKFGNILFLLNNKLYQEQFFSEKYMIMHNNQYFLCENIKYTEDSDKIYIHNLPQIKDLYIPDTYYGKTVSLEKFNFSKMYPWIKKIRVPNYTANYDFLKLSDLQEICFSPKSKHIAIPIACSIEKIICYNNIETVDTRTFIYSNKNLKHFTIGASTEKLKSFNMNYKDSKWFKNMEKTKNKEIIYEGILLSPNVQKEYTFDKEVIFAIDALFRDNKTIEKVNFNKTMKVISKELFSCCENLKKIFIPKNIKIIEDKAFFEEDYTGNKEYSKEVIFEGNRNSIKIAEDAFKKDMELPFD